MKANFAQPTRQQINQEYDNFLYALSPFGSSDIETAINIAITVGEDGFWVGELLQLCTNYNGCKIEGVDIVSLVYNDILETARNEIYELTGFDFVNDDAEIYVIANYMATSYDWQDNNNLRIKDILEHDNIDIETLSIKTQWFLDQIDI